MSEPLTDLLAQPVERFAAALDNLEQAPVFAKGKHVGRVLDTAERVLKRPGGAAALFEFAPRFDGAGLFSGTDWDHPDRLQAGVVPLTLANGQRWTVTLECLNLLRMLAIAEGVYVRSGYSAEQARFHLRKILALSLEYVFDRQSEAARIEADKFKLVRDVLQFVAATVGFESLLEQLVEEIWRLLRQRPIRVDPIQLMITKLAALCYEPGRGPTIVPSGAERLISSLYGPSPASREDPGVAVYAERLASMDVHQLKEEATTCARSMHDTGLVSPYHAVLLRHFHANAPDMIALALGLSTTGHDGYLTYRELVHALIDKAVHPETCQCVYGLAALLERGVLHFPGVASSLWRQIKLPLTSAAQANISAAYGTAQLPEVILLAGVMSALGQPLGIGQGDNPTCQSARAISMWAYSDPDYLLQLLAWAARDDSILMTFHGKQLSSALLQPGESGEVGHDLDPVSLVLVPHLDKVYAEMSRLATTAGEDPHIYVNPEFHGWRVGRGFAIAVDVTSGKLKAYEDFVRLFYACYHPAYNGGHPVIHPQPVGLAGTDSMGRFVGWHAITLLRVTLDQTGTTRVYFYNPNNDSGQDWGHGVQVSTEGHGEFYGEASLPVDQFASRLYLFHYDSREVFDLGAVRQDIVEHVIRQGQQSWAAGR